ncbi:MAG TPA: hypothetical protein VE442_18695 [Jatrophihabitans sp.]|jgi:hypothetical protein|nr:hypothetical protein [Jatrophihabitans sp.]
MKSRTTKVLAAVLAAAAVVGLGVWGLSKLWNTAQTRFADYGCTIGGFDLDTDQAAVASTMVGAVTKYRKALPERASVLVLAAALQESKLTNLPPGDGDRDSVGVLQQRPSQGWGGGHAATLTDVGEATKEFLDALMHVPHWRTRSLASAIQAVQISADGSAYAQHEPEAKALADALEGVKPAAISCDFTAPTKVASASIVAEQAGYQLGINTPRAAGARTVRVRGARWQTVAWFIANADRLGIDRVAYSGRIWTRADGWTKGHASKRAVVATMYDLKA